MLKHVPNLCSLEELRSAVNVLIDVINANGLQVPELVLPKPKKNPRAFNDKIVPPKKVSSFTNTCTRTDFSHGSSRGTGMFVAWRFGSEDCTFIGSLREVASCFRLSYSSVQRQAYMIRGTKLTKYNRSTGLFIREFVPEVEDVSDLLF